jgi:cytochrome c biogenesis protein ResB
MALIAMICIVGCIPILFLEGVIMQTTLVIDGENVTKFLGPSTKNFDQAVRIFENHFKNIDFRLF